MSHAIRNSDFTVINSTTGWQPRPVIREAMETLRSALGVVCSSIESGDTWLSFDNTLGRTTIFATPVDIETRDGYHLLDRLVVKTVLPRGEWQTDRSLLVQINTLATMGALMIDPDTGEAVIVSNVTLVDGEGQEEILKRVYVPLVAQAAVCHPYCLIAVNRGQNDTATGTPGELSVFDEPSHWGLEDFKSTETLLRLAGIFANAGETGLAAEFPWDDGGVSWVTDDETSLLTIQSDMRHPHIGNGLFFKLELPEAYFEEQLVDLVHHLNLLEVTGADVPPFFGAWCSQVTTGRIAYVGFLPNLAYWPQSVSEIAAWLKIRAQTARAVIGNYISRADHTQQEGPFIVSSVK